MLEQANLYFSQFSLKTARTEKKKTLKISLLYVVSHAET